jgi:hypothetical protein
VHDPLSTPGIQASPYSGITSTAPTSGVNRLQPHGYSERKQAVGSDWNGPAHVGSAVDPEGGRRIVLLIIGMITAGSVEHQTTNLMPQRFLISYLTSTAMPTCGSPAWRTPEAAQLSAVGHPSLG